MKQQSEAQLQMSTARYLDARGFLWCHCPNGEARNAVTGAKLKRMGVKRGVPDVLIFNNGRHRDSKGFEYAVYGLAIELKAGKNKTTDEQAIWLLELEGHGWKCAVCYSLDEVVAQVERCYGKGKVK